MAGSQPSVLEGVTLQQFVQYVLDRHEQSSTLVFCGTKEAFFEQLTQSATLKTEESHSGGQNSELPANLEPSNTAPSVQHAWAVPTLRLLLTSRTIKVAFCPDITHLRAYLATYNQPTDNQEIAGAQNHDTRVLAIGNLIHLHRPTSAFSAQGLNRTYAGAVEAAFRSHSKLVTAECLEAASTATNDTDPEGEMLEVAHPRTSSIWDEEVSILNVTTKTFGAGERGWVGRTVKLRRIAARWCVFGSAESA
ncbi:hypothetical protein LTR56_018709 [Elasticomyces elasticus]|nr:hypothetical protein LTR56_018709 [Elasticomyces elasticus]KAK3634282.1 hypothetical protein LTR22_019728 [Elasticomyces elasticus]KAK4915298.1 hypothetical protein LTR49_016567 [Elasticomyces elasticus]KAK5754647.1 hypothetical protein LTS12_015252 [Elasticomyces elasticus]